jgi:hypothetical protein
VALDAAEGWTEQSAASGRVKIFGNQFDPSEGFYTFDIAVNKLQCRGVSFTPEQLEIEPFRVYQLIVNGFPIASFNTSCIYSPKIGGNYRSEFVVEDELLNFDPTTDPLFVKVVLQPDGIVAMESSNGDFIGDTLAVAYVDNGIAGYQPNSDVLIAQLEDTNADGVASIGDTVRTNKYPKNFSVTAGSPSDQFGLFGVTTHMVDSLVVPGGAEVRVRAGGALFSWITEGQDIYSEGSTTFRDGTSPPNGDMIATSPTSPSQPDSEILLFSPDDTDQQFIDVFIP